MTALNRLQGLEREVDERRKTRVLKVDTVVLDSRKPTGNIDTSIKPFIENGKYDEMVKAIIRQRVQP